MNRFAVEPSAGDGALEEGAEPNEKAGLSLVAGAVLFSGGWKENGEALLGSEVGWGVGAEAKEKGDLGGLVSVFSVAVASASVFWDGAGCKSSYERRLNGDYDSDRDLQHRS